MYSIGTQITDNVVIAMKSIGTTSKVFISALNVVPFGFYLIGFINFWTITSMYALLLMDTPAFLKPVLIEIY